MSENIINVGILTPFLEGYYYGGLINSIHTAAKELGYRLIVIQTGSHKQPSEFSNYQYLLSIDNVDGWIVLPQAIEDNYLEVLVERNKPVILVSRQINNSKCQFIVPDNLNSTKQATEHMINHGHKNIAFVGCLKIADVRERFDGYLAALEENNISYSSELVFDTSNALNSGGREAAKQIIANKVPCTAIIAGTDANAFGVLEALKDAGYRIPDEIAIFGYDDNAFSKTLNPSLSTIRQNIDTIGCRAVKSLSKQIAEKIVDSGTIYVKSDLIIRQSCGCAENTTPHYSVNQNKFDDKSPKVFEHLSQNIINSYKIVNNFAKSSCNEIKNLMWLDLTSYSWACLGLWNEAYDHLVVDQFYNKQGNLPSLPALTCSTRAFPPLEFLPDSTHSGGNDIVWLHPIKTDFSKLGVLALVGPINESNLLTNFDTMSHCFDLLAFVLEYKNEKEISENAKVSKMRRNVHQFLQTRFKDIIIPKGMLEWLREDLSVLRETSGDSFFDTDNLLYHMIRELEKKAKSNLSPIECNIFLPELRKLKFKNIKQLLNNYSKYALKHSNSLNKLVLPFDIQGEDILLDPDIYNGFCKSLVYVFRSMIEHSIEFPDERLEKGKNQYGIISCKTEFYNNNIYIELSDDGKGLDTDTVLKKVEKKIDKLGGKIEVESKKDIGTTFRFILPYHQKIIDKKVTARSILNPLIQKTSDLFTNDYCLSLLGSSSFRPQKAQRITLKDVTTTLDIKGLINCKLIITVNENLGRNIVRKFILEELTPEKELLYVENVLSECINIIIGNSIESLDEDLDKLISIQTPKPILSKNCFLRFSKSETWTCNMTFEEGELILGFVYPIDTDDNMFIE